MSPIDRRGRRPAFPLQPRHEYAADLPHGLRADHEIPTPESPTPSGQACTAPRPTSTRLEPMPRLRGFSHWFALATPSRLACRTRAVWQCRPVPSLSGLLPSTPCASKAGLPPASTTRCDGPPLDISFHSVNRRLVAHSALEAHPGKSQGRPNEKPGLEAHRANRPTRQRSPNRRPLSRIARPYGPARTEPPTSIFMPRDAAVIREATQPRAFASGQWPLTTKSSAKGASLVQALSGHHLALDRWWPGVPRRAGGALARGEKGRALAGFPARAGEARAGTSRENRWSGGGGVVEVEVLERRVAAVFGQAYGGVDRLVGEEAVAVHGGEGGAEHRPHEFPQRGAQRRVATG